MNGPMNCFDWQSRACDFLDGTLIGTLKREADAHLESCFRCQTRHKHYQQILSSIHSLPRSPLPVAIRKAPFRGLGGPFLWLRLSHRNFSWETTPWPIRVGLEALGITLVVLGTVSVAPKIRSYYDRAMEKKVDELLLAEKSGESADPASPPLARGKPASPDGATSSHDDFAGENASEPEGNVTPGPSQELNLTGASAQNTILISHPTNTDIWRFHLKTDSPSDTRHKIIEALKHLKIPQETPGFGGIEVPGGIQFDLLLPIDAVVPLKQNLQTIAESRPLQPHDSVATNERSSFSWFKNKAKRPFPPGKSRVVIWLSQM